MRRSGSGAAIALALAVGGCGVGSKVIDKSELEKGARDALAKTVGRAPQSVSCPKDLNAKVGASERCTLTDHGTTLGMTISVKAVKGGKATYDVAVDQK